MYLTLHAVLIELRTPERGRPALIIIIIIIIIQSFVERHIAVASEALAEQFTRKLATGSIEQVSF